MINLDLTELQSRLATECPLLGERVVVALPPDELTIEAFESPTAFVYPLSELSGDNTLQRSLRQWLDMAITIEIIVRRTATADDRYGAADLEALTDTRREVYAALMGWTPTGAETPLQHKEGNLKKTDKTQAHWIDTYTCKTHNTGQPL